MKWWAGLLRWAELLLALVASAALAQGGPSAGNGRTSRGNLLPIPQYRTPGTGAQTYYVDAASGSDNNNCTASGASACATIQGALNKIPKLIRDGVTVNVAAGNYAGFILSGFAEDYGQQQTTGGLFINGTLANSTLATGSATGTATSGTAGSGVLFGTLTDTGATWTANDLKGRFISTSNPTNVPTVIDSNTSTSITVVGFWNAPTNATTYTIQDPSSIITSGVAVPPSGVANAIANRAGILSFGNSLAHNSSTIAIQNLRVATSSTNGIEIEDNASYRLQQLQVRQSSATANGIAVGVVFAAATPNVALQNVDIANSPTGAAGQGLQVPAGVLSVTSCLIRNIGSGSGLAALTFGVGGASAVRANTIFSSDMTGFENGIVLVSGLSNTVGNFKGNHITCFDSAGVGLSLGSTSFISGGATTEAGVPAGITSVQTHVFATCGIAVQVSGGATMDITSISGSAGTTGVAVNSGALVSMQSGGLAMSGVANEISLDSGAVTAAFADITVGKCVNNLQYATRICGR